MLEILDLNPALAEVMFRQLWDCSEGCPVTPSRLCALIPGVRRKGKTSQKPPGKESWVGTTQENLLSCTCFPALLCQAGRLKWREQMLRTTKKHLVAQLKQRPWAELQRRRGWSRNCPNFGLIINLPDTLSCLKAAPNPLISLDMPSD